MTFVDTGPGYGAAFASKQVKAEPQAKTEPQVKAEFQVKTEPQAEAEPLVKTEPAESSSQNFLVGLPSQ